MINEIQEMINQAISSEQPILNINLSDKLQDVGLDSFSFIKLITLVEEKYDIEFEEDELIPSKFITIEGLINEINLKRNLTRKS